MRSRVNLPKSTQGMTPRCDAFLKARLQAWMDDHRICAYQEVVWCMGEVLEPTTNEYVVHLLLVVYSTPTY